MYITFIFSLSHWDSNWQRQQSTSPAFGISTANCWLVFLIVLYKGKVSLMKRYMQHFSDRNFFQKTIRHCSIIAEHGLIWEQTTCKHICSQFMLIPGLRTRGGNVGSTISKLLIHCLWATAGTICLLDFHMNKAWWGDTPEPLGSPSVKYENPVLEC